MDADQVYGKYLGKYVIITVPSRSSSAGKLIDIEGGDALLSPHMSSRYHPIKGSIRGLTSKVETVNLMGADIAPTTERSLRAYCSYLNREERLKSKSKRHGEGEQ